MDHHAVDRRSRTIRRANTRIQRLSTYRPVLIRNRAARRINFETQTHLKPRSNFKETAVLTSTDKAGSEDPNNRPSQWRPTVSQTAAANKRDFAPLTIEEQKTYRKWRRSTLIFYGVLALFMTAFMVAIGPPEPTTAKHNAAYSAIASAGQHKSH
jgi:hypothetical protein